MEISRGFIELTPYFVWHCFLLLLRENLAMNLAHLDYLRATYSVGSYFLMPDEFSIFCLENVNNRTDLHAHSRNNNRKKIKIMLDFT